jgi:hypothetical protein
MLELAFLRGLVVVGIRRQYGIDAANLLEQLGLAQQRAGGVVGAAGPHGNTARCGVGNDADGMQPFLFIERCGFACGPAGYEEINTRVDLPVDQRAHCLVIN